MTSPNLIPQAAAIPFRLLSNGNVDVMLIRWAKESAWGIPKGLVDPGNDHRETAIIESMEEAGIEGMLLKEKLGEFTYAKYRGYCRVQVFGLKVLKLYDEYEEKGYRVRSWFPLEEAIKSVAREAVKPIITDLGRKIEAGTITELMLTPTR